MSQLDFREALSSPEEKVCVMPVAVSAAQSHLPAPDFYLPEVGLSRSAWANIFFVAIAAIGGVVCAFYFFNGSELLRAAAAWPAEFLYPRPISTESIEVAALPNAVDQYTTSDSKSTAGKNDEAQGSAEQNPRPTQLAQFPAPANTLGSTPTVPSNVPPIVPPIVAVGPPSVPPIVPSVIPPVVPPTDSLVGGANTVVTGVDAFGQSLDQTVNQTVTAVLPKDLPTVSTRSTASSARKKVASTRQKLPARPGAVTSIAKSASDTTQSLTTSLQSPAVANQTMFGGGMGAVGGIGSAGNAGGVGASGTGVSGVGTPGGVSGPGVSGPGLGGPGLGGPGIGGISGIGGIGGIGGVSGIIGGHH
ncbi:MAG TPA: hypothetical protein VLK27_02110 [Chthoniobacterales bacterium]|nr:hypothetical protein [Chthoniobacterales bacterium]